MGLMTIIIINTAFKNPMKISLLKPWAYTFLYPFNIDSIHVQQLSLS